MRNKCKVCGVEFETVKAAQTCSARCRVTLSRLRVTEDPNVTPNVTRVTEPELFEFSTPSRNNEKPPVRAVKYWYEVPLAAKPVLKEGWPKMFDYMNGRQYFLWWKNEFKKKEDGSPIIHNPFPVRDNVRYEMGGETSRKWGA